MMKEEVRVRCYDNFYLNVYIYGDYTKKFKGVVQISHGKGEYSQNYLDLIERLVKENYIVCIHDHRGHGRYNKGKEYFSLDTCDNNFALMVKDLNAINSFLKWKFKGSKIFLIGHSMGAYLSLKYSEVYGDTIDGLVLSGIGKDNKLNLNMPVIITKFVSSFKDASKPNKFVNKNVFKTLNKTFNEDDKYAFTTSNKDVLKRYSEDELRIKEYTLKFYHDLFCGIRHTLKENSLKKVPEDLKVIILAGSLDPVSSFDKGVKRLNKSLLKGGVDSQYKIYENMRHEIFVEDDRDKVFDDVLEFLRKLS